MLALALRYGRWIIAFAVIAFTAVVISPEHTKPLWAWLSNLIAESGQTTPDFAEVQRIAMIGLSTLLTGGLGYNWYRDRKFKLREAEYQTHTGADNLKRENKQLKQQITIIEGERDDWRSKHDELNTKHVEVLLQSKEHEVRREFGEKDSETLAELRVKFETMLADKTKGEGFQEALQIVLGQFPNSPQTVNVQTAVPVEPDDEVLELGHNDSAT